MRSTGGTNRADGACSPMTCPRSGLAFAPKWTDFAACLERGEREFPMGKRWGASYGGRASLAPQGQAVRHDGDAIVQPARFSSTRCRCVAPRRKQVLKLSPRPRDGRRRRLPAGATAARHRSRMSAGPLAGGADKEASEVGLFARTNDRKKARGGSTWRAALAGHRKADGHPTSRAKAR